MMHSPSFCLYQISLKERFFTVIPSFLHGSSSPAEQGILVLRWFSTSTAGVINRAAALTNPLFNFFCHGDFANITARFLTGTVGAHAQDHTLIPLWVVKDPTWAVCLLTTKLTKERRQSLYLTPPFSGPGQTQ